MRILTTVAVLIEVIVFVLIQLKNRNLGRLVRAVRFENELNSNTRTVST